MSTPAKCPVPVPVPAVGTEWTCPVCGVVWQVNKIGLAGAPGWVFNIRSGGKETGYLERVCR